jgi:AraC-like DNA-binding protein
MPQRKLFYASPQEAVSEAQQSSGSDCLEAFCGENTDFPPPGRPCFVEATGNERQLIFNKVRSLLPTLAELSNLCLNCHDVAALIRASLTSHLEETAVSRRSAGTLSAIENEVIQEIRSLRGTTGEGFHRTLLDSPARTARHFILDSHGNVQLRLATIARELGVEMRTLERSFFEEYRQTMVECQTETRLLFSKSLLSVFPPTKISAVAALLGYRVVQDFNRFFKRHMHLSPSQWSGKERARIASGKAQPSND